MNLVYERSYSRDLAAILNFSNDTTDYFVVAEIVSSVASAVFSTVNELSSVAKEISQCGQILFIPALFIDSYDLFSHLFAGEFSSCLTSLLKVTYDLITLLNLYSSIFSIDPVSLGLRGLNFIKSMILLASLVGNSNEIKSDLNVDLANLEKEAVEKYKGYLNDQLCYAQIASSSLVVVVCVGLLEALFTVPFATVIKSLGVAIFGSSLILKNYFDFYKKKQFSLMSV
jgi:hypothetical protein